jgi:hypothetical protein
MFAVLTTNDRSVATFGGSCASRSEGVLVHLQHLRLRQAARLLRLNSAGSLSGEEIFLATPSSPPSPGRPTSQLLCR